MKQKRIIRFRIFFKNGLIQEINVIFKNKNDLKLFEKMKFNNVIRIDKINNTREMI